MEKKMLTIEVEEYFYRYLFALGKRDLMTPEMVAEILIEDALGCQMAEGGSYNYDDE